MFQCNKKTISSINWPENNSIRQKEKSVRALLVAVPSKDPNWKHTSCQSVIVYNRKGWLHESFLTNKIKYMWEIIKRMLIKPVICRKCLICVDRIDIHVNHHHQMHHRADHLYQEIDKCKNFTREYEKKLFSSQLNISENDDEKLKIKRKQIQRKWDRHKKLPKDLQEVQNVKKWKEVNKKDTDEKLSKVNS